MDWISATIGGAAGLAQGFVNQGFAKRNLKRQVAALKELADYNADINKDLYTFQMEDQRNWNEHAEQLGKMAEAGINPLYAEGGFQGAGTANVDGVSTGSAGMPQADMDFISAVQAGLKQQEIKIQQQNANTNEKSVDSQIEKNQAEIEKTFAELGYTEQATEKVKTEIEDLKSQIVNRQKEIELKVQDLQLTRLRLGIDIASQKWKMSKETAEFGLQQQMLDKDWYRAKTERLNFGLAKEQFERHKHEWNREYQLKYAETDNLLKDGHLDRVIKMLEQDDVTFAGFKLKGKDLNEAMGTINSCITFVTSPEFWPAMMKNPKDTWNLITHLTKRQKDIDNATLFDLDTNGHTKKWSYFDEESGKYTPPSWSNKLTNP